MDILIIISRYRSLCAAAALIAVSYRSTSRVRDSLTSCQRRWLRIIPRSTLHFISALGVVSPTSPDTF
jgi:hypothetical protein